MNLAFKSLAEDSTEEVTAPGSFLPLTTQKLGIVSARVSSVVHSHAAIDLICFSQITSKQVQPSKPWLADMIYAYAAHTPFS